MSEISLAPGLVHSLFSAGQLPLGVVQARTRRQDDRRRRAYLLNHCRYQPSGQGNENRRPEPSPELAGDVISEVGHPAIVARE